MHSIDAVEAYRRWKHNFYNSKDWKLISKQRTRIDNYKCRHCGRNLMFKGKREVDHIVEITIDNYFDRNITHNINNTRLLCTKCHNKRHSRFVGYSLLKDNGEIDFNSRSEQLCKKKK